MTNPYPIERSAGDSDPAIDLDHDDEDFDDGSADLVGVDDDQVDDDADAGEFGDLPAGDYLVVQLLDGTRYPLRITMRERIGYDAVAIKKGWGRPQESPNRAAAFMAWSAGRREGLPAHAASFDQWVNAVDDVVGHSVAARPTR